MLLRKTLQIGVLLGAVFATGWLLADDDKQEGRGGSRGLPQVTNAKWQAECSGCHMLYQPYFLPERSWRKMMGELDKHFGENAGLDPLTQKEITDFLVQNSADHASNRRAAKFIRSIPSSQAPQRISETPYFTREHDEIKPDVWKRQKIGSKANCIACHANAEKGNYSEDDVKIPR